MESVPKPAPFQVVPWEAFEQLQREVAMLRQKVEREENLRLTRSLMTPKETAQVLKCCIRTVFRMEDEGKITAVRYGKKVNYTVDSVRAYLIKRSINPDEINNRLLIATFLP